MPRPERFQLVEFYEQSIKRCEGPRFTGRSVSWFLEIQPEEQREVVDDRQLFRLVFRDKGIDRSDGVDLGQRG